MHAPLQQPLEAPPPPPGPSQQKIQCRALYDFQASHPEHLGITKDEQMTVIKLDVTNTGWTLVENSGGEQGKTPTNYIKIGDALLEIQPIHL